MRIFRHPLRRRDEILNLCPPSLPFRYYLTCCLDVFPVQSELSGYWRANDRTGRGRFPWNYPKMAR